MAIYMRGRAMEQALEILNKIIHHDIFIQGLGFVGLVITIISIQNKSYNKMIFFKILSAFVFGSQYFLLGGYTGMATNLVSCATNGVYTYRINTNKSTLPFQIAFCILFIVIGILTWEGPASLLVIVAKVLTTVTYGFKDTKYMRKANLITYPLWLIYDILCFSIGGIINDILLIISTVVAVVRFDIKKKPKKS